MRCSSKRIVCIVVVHASSWACYCVRCICLVPNPPYQHAQALTELTAAAAQRAPGGKVVAVLSGGALPGVAMEMRRLLGASTGQHGAPPYMTEADQDKLDQAWWRAMRAQRVLADATPQTLQPTWTMGIAAAGLGLVATRFPKTMVAIGGVGAASVLYMSYEVSRCARGVYCFHWG